MTRITPITTTPPPVASALNQRPISTESESLDWGGGVGGLLERVSIRSLYVPHPFSASQLYNIYRTWELNCAPPD